MEEFLKLTESYLLQKAELRLNDFLDVNFSYYYNKNWSAEQLADHLISIKNGKLFKEEEDAAELKNHFIRMNKQYQERKIYRDHEGRLWKDADGIIKLYEKLKEKVT